MAAVGSDDQPPAWGITALLPDDGGGFRIDATVLRDSALTKLRKLCGILQNDTRVRTYHHGEVVVRQGDYGNSAFLVLEGSVRVLIEGLEPAMIGRPVVDKRSRIRSLLGLFTSPGSPEARASEKRNAWMTAGSGSCLRG